MQRNERVKPGTSRRRALLPVVLLPYLQAAAFELEMGAVTIQDTFVTPAATTVTFQRSFPATPLVFVLPTTDGGDPATARVLNVSTTGFQVVQVEPSGNDGPHVAMPTAYLAIEPGDHVFPDGSKIAAFEITTGAFVSPLLTTTWVPASFPSAFGATPAIVAQIQTMNSEALPPPSSPPTTSSIPFMDVGIRNVGASGLQVSLERAESAAGTVSPERIGILAVDNGAAITFIDSFGTSVLLQTLLTPDNIRGYANGCYTNSFSTPFAGTPLAVASQNRRDGNNGGWVRRCSLSSTSIGLTVDEDIDNDAERDHTTESAGIVAASTSFHANFDVDLSIDKTVLTLSDPINGSSDQKSIPEAIVEYTIAVENAGSGSPDADSVTITDTIPGDLALCVSAACQPGGPVVLDSTGSPTPPGVTVGLVEYSDDGGASWSYAPAPDPNGFDTNVDAVRITLGGTLSGMSTGGAPSFAIRLVAKIE